MIKNCCSKYSLKPNLPSNNICTDAIIGRKNSDYELHNTDITYQNTTDLAIHENDLDRFELNLVSFGETVIRESNAKTKSLYYKFQLTQIISA